MLTLADIQINPDHNWSDYHKTLKENGRVQIPNFFTEKTASGLAAMIEQHKIWYLAYNEYDNYFESTLEDVMALSPQEISRFMQGVNKRASTHFQYVFWQYYITQAVDKNENPGNPMHMLHDWTNGTDFIKLLQSLTGDQDVSWCDVFISRYDPGHFLTNHDDTHPKHNRTAAYTIGMTKDWNPNWGGHLVFLDKKGDIKEGFMPEFNTLSLFYNPQDHAVQMVTPSAGKSRVSLLGWANKE